RHRRATAARRPHDRHAAARPAVDRLISAIEPAGGDQVALLAAALRADASDLATYERVLVGSLQETSPPGCVEVDRERSLSDRVAGRPGTPRAIRISLGEVKLELTMVKGRLVGT